MNIKQVRENMMHAMREEIVKVVDMFTYNNGMTCDVKDVAREMRYRRNHHRFTYSMELGDVRIRNGLNQLAKECRVYRRDAFKSHYLNLPVRYTSVK